MNATFNGAILQGADLSYADFSDIYFDKNADFKKSILKRANFDKADLSELDFSGADLQEARFNKAELRGTIFASADMNEADMQNADAKPLPQHATGPSALRAPARYGIGGSMTTGWLKSE